MTDNNAENFDESMLNTDESLAGTTHLNETVGTEDEIEKYRTELAEQKDKYLRLFAEFDNYKRRTAKERMEQMATAGKEVITDLLDVLDDIDRTEAQMKKSDDANAIKEGVGLVFSKLRYRLEQKGLKPMETLQQDFNEDLHEAVAQIPAPAANLEGKIIDEVQKGYLLNDKIIRFAKVVVAN